MKHAIVLLFATALNAGPALAQQPSGAVAARPVAEPDRTVLPIAEPVYPPITELDARKAQAPSRFEVRAPKGAPNVVIVLIDDMGFGQPSTFGGGVAMPTLDRLAVGGLRYNHFHTTALCSPTRVALKTGRNHHSANGGTVMEIATAFPGSQAAAPQRAAWPRCRSTARRSRRDASNTPFRESSPATRAPTWVSMRVRP